MTEILNLQKELETIKSVTSNYSNSYISKQSINNIRSHYSNGLSKHISKVKCFVYTDYIKCKNLWEEFSPKKNLFDLWDFRYSFNDAYKFKPHFLLIKKDNENIALLPLCFNHEKNVYWWFGGDWQEENSFFTKDNVYIPLLLYLSPTPLALYAIKDSLSNSLPSGINFTNCDSKYILNLKLINTLEKYFRFLKKKKRYNLHRDIKRIEKLNPKIVLNKFEDFDIVNQILIKRFHSKGTLADWEEDNNIVQAFKNIIKNNNKSYSLRMLSVYINGILAASDINALYKSTYYTLKGAYDVDNFPGIGNYIFVKEIEDALSLGMNKIDFLQEDYGWKHKWFTEVHLYRYKNE